MAGSHPLAGYTEFWDDVMADMEATAEEYREAGWEVLELHPGDVTPLPTVALDAPGTEAERTGFDVLLPGEEFEAAQELAEAAESTDGPAAFAEYDAYRAQQSGVVFLVVVMKAEAAGQAVAFPLYYDEQEARPMLELAHDAGELRAYLRPLDDSERVVFSLSDPVNLLPPEWSASGAGADGGADAADDADGDTDADE